MTETSQQSEALRPSRIYAAAAAVLLILGLLLPWNVHVGAGIAETRGWVFAIMVIATVPCLAALFVVESVPRWALTVPYLILVGVFTVFAIVISVRYGGTGMVAPGVGPGAWSGLAGALLAAQPRTATCDQQRADRTCRLIGWSSIVLAVLATLFNLYFRTRFVIPGIGGDAGIQNLATAVAALLYGVVALAPALVAGRWVMSGRPGPRLAAVLLGGAAVVAGALVWFLPAGRLLDAFHGIAQNTGTVSVGYEGYLAWIAVAAIIGTPVLRSARAAGSAELWRYATRCCLALITVWCGGKAVLRITDVWLAGVLSLPTPPYNTTMLMAFDLLTAVLALWLFVNSRNRSASRTVTVVVLGILVVLTVCRLILGVALVPRIDPLNPGTVNPVFGNHLVQQITSTFDVTLSFVALLLLTGAVGFRARTSTKAVSAQPVPRPAAADTPTPAAAARIAAPNPVEAQPAAAPDRVTDVLAQSTQRFAAGTTYGGGPSTVGESESGS
ncbi:hypothetical protein [Mycolicibacter kumamotonensis]|uniref:DUF7937 domain-containing protein n=1 Tax=Mycolicibacter kumamotonensis TaxID=354243 RepID=A0A7K3LFP8_9MYCO|nr:hypothetical protein [Mycolicibacter kumamotonensis]NDJ90940.1 hypothetical protein [Mycolicibacter kumamotonensis]